MANKKYKEMSGLKFGQLMVLSKAIRPAHIITKATYWNCQCDCGKLHVVKRSSLLNGEIKTCGCGHSKRKEKSPFWKGYEQVYGDMVSNYKRSAEKRGLAFDLDAKFLWELYIRQGRKCYISGLDLHFATTSYSHDGNLSLDRIDSAKGYTKDNVGWVEKRINHMKWDLSLEEFKQLCTTIINYDSRPIKN